MDIINKNIVIQHNEITKNIQTKIDSTNYTLENPLIILNPYKTSPLTALITFTTEETGRCSVKIHSKYIDEGSITHTFDAVTNKHLLPIYGLYPDYDNTVTIEFTAENSESVKVEHKIKTSPLPENMTEISAINKSNTQQLTFITDNYTRAFDRNGEIRWYLVQDITITKNSPILFLQNGNIAVMNNKLLHHHCFVSGFLELNLLGKIENEYIINGVSHEILELKNGDFLVVCEKDDISTEDYIAIIDRKTGSIKFDYDFKEILAIPCIADPCYQYSMLAYRKILDRYIPERKLVAEVKLKYIYDWLHINSVYYNEDENYLIVSCRIKDCVIKLDAITKEIIWIFTDSDGDWCEIHYDKILKPTNFDKPNYCYAQHSAQITPNGELLIFDNGNFRSKEFLTATQPNENYSRAVAYKVDDENLTITQTYSFGENLPEKLYNCYLGNVQYLNQDHYLINFGGIVTDDEGDYYDSPVVMRDESIRLKTVICEVLEGDETARYQINSVNTYRASREDIYTNSRYLTLTEAKILGEARATQQAQLNTTLEEIEKSELLEYTINEVIDLGERLVYDITFNNSDKDDDKYLVFTGEKELLLFEFKADNNVIGINKCTIECLADNYKVGLFSFGETNLFTWI